MLYSFIANSTDVSSLLRNTRPFETYVYSLQSAFGVSLSQGQQSGADLQENSLGHSSGCFESSESATHSHRASTVPWNQGLTFDYLSGAGQHQAERSVAQMGTLTLDSCSETTFMLVDTCDVTTMVPGSTGSDSYQYIGDTHPSYVECRYRVPLLLVLNSILITHLWSVLPVYPVYYTVLSRHSQLHRAHLMVVLLQLLIRVALVHHHRC